MTSIPQSDSPVKLTKLQRELLTVILDRADEAGDAYLSQNRREWECLNRLARRGLVAMEFDGEGKWLNYWNLTPNGILVARAALDAAPARPVAAAPTAQPDLTKPSPAALAALSRDDEATPDAAPRSALTEDALKLLSAFAVAPLPYVFTTVLSRTAERDFFILKDGGFIKYERLSRAYAITSAGEAALRSEAK